MPSATTLTVMPVFFEDRQNMSEKSPDCSVEVVDASVIESAAAAPSAASEMRLRRTVSDAIWPREFSLYEKPASPRRVVENSPTDMLAHPAICHEHHIVGKPGRLPRLCVVITILQPRCGSRE